MANEIKNAFETAFRDFVTDGVPSSGRNKVKKIEARAIGPLIENRLDSLSAGYAVNYATRPELYADLNWDDDLLARVFGDANPAYIGVYKKSGASGTGSWSKIGELPEADTTALQAQVDDVDDRVDVLEPLVAGKLDSTLTAYRDLLATAAVKTAPVDADRFTFFDSETSYAAVRFTWASLLARIWAQFGALIAGGSAKTTPVDDDTIPLSDSEVTATTRKLSLTNLKAFLKSYFDGQYPSKSIATDRLLGRDDSGTGDVGAIAVTNGLTFTGSSQIGLADMPEATIKGRVAGGGPGTPTNLTAAQARTAISAQLASANLDDWSLAPALITPAASDQSIPGIFVDQTGYIVSTGIYADIDGTVEMPELSIIPGDASELQYSVDQIGYVIPLTADTNGVTSSIEDRLFAEQDARAQAYSAAVPTRPLPIFAGLYWDYILTVTYGQSLSRGGASPLPKTVAVPDFGVVAKMVGYSVRAAVESDTYYPFWSTVNANGVETNGIGTFALRDMVATSDGAKSAGGSVYDYTDWVISPDSGHDGEDASVGYSYSLCKLVNESRNELNGNYANRALIGASLGEGNTTVEELLRTDDMDVAPYSARNRLLDFSTQLAAHIAASYPGKTIGIGNWIFIQGEKDATSGTSITDYKGGLGDLKTVFDEDVAAEFDQDVSPLMLMVQTGQHWVRGQAYNVPQAQHEFALENHDKGVRLVTNTAAVPGKFAVPPAPGFVALPDSGMTSATLNEHKDGNATRWLAAYAAKVDHKMRWKRENWQHPHIREASRVAGSSKVGVSWHCPVGPIRFKKCWIGYRYVMLVNYGVQFFQGTTEIGFTSAEVSGQTIVFTLDSAPDEEVSLQIRVGTAEGRHNIWDSDPDVARFNYEHSHQDFAAFDPDPGNMTAGEILVNNEAIQNLGVNGAGLWTNDADPAGTGLPYPLPNMAVIEVFTVTTIS